MGCLSMTINQVPPSIAISVVRADGASATASDTMSRPDVTATPVNWIGATIAKAHRRAEAEADSLNTGINISAWLICNVSTSGMYLAVNEGLILTLDNGYLVVRRA